MDGSNFELIKTLNGKVLLAKRYSNGKVMPCDPQPKLFTRQIIQAAAVILQEKRGMESQIIEAMGGGKLVYYPPEGADTE